MGSFEYIFLLTSIVLAAGIERILFGIGWVLQNRHRLKLYWVHLLWGLNVFLFLVLNWWILYRWHTNETWTFFLAIFVLTSPIITFLLCALLFPHHTNEITDLKQQYFANHRWFFVLGAVLPLIDSVDTYLKGKAHFLAQGPVYFVTIPLLFSLNLVASITKNERYHKFFAIFISGLYPGLHQVKLQTLN